jgi:hypothetical protein
MTQSTLKQTRFCIKCNRRFVPTAFNEKTMVEIHGSVTTTKGTFCSGCYKELMKSNRKFLKYMEKQNG